MMPAQATSWARRRWSGYGVGAISRNVITPYYYGDHGSHYSYVAPDPIPGPTTCAIPTCRLCGRLVRILLYSCRTQRYHLTKRSVGFPEEPRPGSHFAYKIKSIAAAMACT